MTLPAVKLSELHPQLLKSPLDHPSMPHRADARIAFTCPKCRKGAVFVDIRVGDALGGIHGANHLPPPWDDLTITPSIAYEGKCTRCEGWHGHITNGDVQ
jgi:hypothetical protein